MIGQTISHYRILEKVGAGGMGEVYRARDERLERDVALKVLPAGMLADEEARRRFRKEALALSRLNHPNVATVHDFDSQEGVDFLVMEFIPGVTLSEKLVSGPLSEKETAGLGNQIAEGLEAGHRENVIHRDIKPANVRVTPDGRIKILDFGLAKVLRPTNDLARTQSLTETLAVTGTLPYMAPEQVRGEAVDARTDIWALGAVLYEMVTGQRPFREELATRLAEAILHQAPAPLRVLNGRVSGELEWIILKCLDKQPENRYQSAKELAVDLRRLSTPAQAVAVPRPRRRAPARRWAVALASAVGLIALVSAGLYLFSAREQAIDSLAVLPFANASGDPNTEYLSDGITESIINSVSQLPNVKVIARTSVFRYKGREVDPRDVARELGVRAVLVGRLIQRGDTLSISAELVDARDNRHIWGEQYNSKLRDLLAVQDEIAKEISDKLRLRLTGEDRRRLTKRYTENGQAYQAYLKGRYYSSKYTEEGFKKGVDYFRQAIVIDPTYALAYAGLTVAYWNVSNVQFAPQEVMPKAKEAALKALEIDDTLAESHAAVALVKMAYDWERVDAEREYRRAIGLNPGYALAYEWHGWHLALMGHLEESVAELQRAQERDPLSAEISAYLGLSLYWARQYGPATEQLHKALELDQNFWFAHELLGWAYQQSGAFPEALAEFQTARRLDDNPWTLADLGHLYAVQGKRADAQKMLAELKERARRRYVSPYFIARVYTGLNEKEQAFAWLEKAYEARDESLTWLKVDPVMESLRSDPRFQDLLHRLGLPPQDRLTSGRCGSVMVAEGGMRPEATASYTALATHPPDTTMGALTRPAQSLRAGPKSIRRLPLLAAETCAGILD